MFQDSSLRLTGAFLTSTYLVEQANRPAHAAEAFGHTELQRESGDGGLLIEVRPARRRRTEPQPPDCFLQGFYRHPFDGKGVELTLAADDSASLAGAEFDCEFTSNYPELSMSIPRTPIHAGIHVRRTHRALPGDYLAAVCLRYWNGDARPSQGASLILRAVTERAKGAPLSVELRLYPRMFEED